MKSLTLLFVLLGSALSFKSFVGRNAVSHVRPAQNYGKSVERKIWTQKHLFPLNKERAVEVISNIHYGNQPIPQIFITLAYFIAHLARPGRGDDFSFVIEDVISILFICVHLVTSQSKGGALGRRSVPWQPQRSGLYTLATFCGIFVFFVIGGLTTPFIEFMLNVAAIFVPMTIPMQKSLTLLLSHCAWVLPSIAVLQRVDGFLGKSKGTGSNEKDIKAKAGEGEMAKTIPSAVIGRDDAASASPEFGQLADTWKARKAGGSDWMTWSWKTSWVWWVIGGYSVSLSLFKLVDWINMSIMPAALFEQGSAISDIVADHYDYNGHFAAVVVGALAPCLTAPVWEEVLYRALLLPWLSSFLPMRAAVPTSALLFALSHMRVDTVLPLFALGWLWSMLYIRSGNLFVVMVVHIMWNTQVLLRTLMVGS